MQYPVLRPLNHDQRDYAPGDLVELPDGVAAYLQSTGTVGEAIDATAEAQGDAPTNKSLSVDAINNLNKNGLVELPNVGQKTADKLIAARPFDSLDAAKAASELSDTRWNEVIQALIVHRP